MRMNLKRAEKSMQNVLQKEFDFTTKADVSENEVSITANVSLKGIDDDIVILSTVYKDGTMIVDAILDKLPINENSLQLLQDFNQGSLYIKAYVNQDGYLILKHTVIWMTNDLVEDTLRATLNTIASDNNIKLLQPLAALTE